MLNAHVQFNSFTQHITQLRVMRIRLRDENDTVLLRVHSVIFEDNYVSLLYHN